MRNKRVLDTKNKESQTSPAFPGILRRAIPQFMCILRLCKHLFQELISIIHLWQGE